MTPEAVKTLMDYSWPGNVRELKNLIERLVIMTPDNTITENHLPSVICANQTPTTRTSIITTGESSNFKGAKEEFEKEFLIQKLEENDWNISRTAEAIEIERSNLHRKIKSFGIELRK
jgi:two-component system nitrogen regulation response regulator NtrX